MKETRITLQFNNFNILLIFYNTGLRLKFNDLFFVYCVALKSGRQHFYEILVMTSIITLNFFSSLNLISFFLHPDSLIILYYK